MLKRLVWPAYFLIALVVAYFIYMRLPDYIQKGGPLVAILVFLLMGVGDSNPPPNPLI